MNLKEYCLEIENFLKSYLEESPCKNYCLGLSGGVDSSLVAAIAAKAVGKEHLFLYNFPIDSNIADQKDALKVANLLGLDLKIVDLSSTYAAFLKQIDGEKFSRLTKSNLKVRIRMCAIYAYAQEKNALVLGTDNWDENYVGYFTKFGDGACDILPIVHLTKEEVREAAKLYGISEQLAERIPSAGLFEGQTDETEMGVTYKELDAYLLGKPVSDGASKRIEYLHNISKHKRDKIPSTNYFDRN